MEQNYYVSKEQFAAITSTWVKSHHHHVWEHIIYNVLRNKPADLGFTQRTKNIQGNNPWYAFNQALEWAKHELNSAITIKKWGVVGEEETRVLGLKVASKPKYGWIEEPNPHYKSFKDRFGIDMPDDFAAKLEAVEKKRTSPQDYI